MTAEVFRPAPQDSLGKLIAKTTELEGFFTDNKSKLRSGQREIEIPLVGDRIFKITPTIDSDGHLIHKLSLTDERTRSFKRITLYPGTSMFELTEDPRTLGDSSDGKVFTLKIESGVKNEYDAVSKPEFYKDEEAGIEHNTAFSTLVEMQEGIAGESHILTGIKQKVGVLTNPESDVDKYPLLGMEFTMNFNLRYPGFHLDFDLESIYKGNFIISELGRYYMENKYNKAIYEGENVSVDRTTSPNRLLANVVVGPAADRVGREQMARLMEAVPSEFSDGQVDRMIANSLEGRIATAGIWNPLVLPELRKASKR